MVFLQQACSLTGNHQYLKSTFSFFFFKSLCNGDFVKFFQTQDTNAGQKQENKKDKGQTSICNSTVWKQSPKQMYFQGQFPPLHLLLFLFFYLLPQKQTNKKKPTPKTSLLKSRNKRKSPEIFFSFDEIMLLFSGQSHMELQFCVNWKQDKKRLVHKKPFTSASSRPPGSELLVKKEHKAQFC